MGKSKEGPTCAKRLLGMAGEDAAAVYLVSKGYTVIERNYRTRSGEVDIIATDGEAIRFIEVKTRGNSDYGRPGEAVNRKKMAHIKAAALEYLYEVHPAEMELAFDVMEVSIEHIKGAF